MRLQSFRYVLLLSQDKQLPSGCSLKVCYYQNTQLDFYSTINQKSDPGGNFSLSHCLGVILHNSKRGVPNKSVTQTWFVMNNYHILVLGNGKICCLIKRPIQMTLVFGEIVDFQDLYSTYGEIAHLLRTSGFKS